MQHVPIQTARSHGLRLALVLTLCVFILPSCISKSKDGPDIADIVPADPREGVATSAPAPGPEDQQASAATAGQIPPASNAMLPMTAQAQMPAQAQAGSVVLQATGLKATSSSIFSSAPVGQASGGTQMPLGNGNGPNSLYRTTPTPAQAFPLQPMPSPPVLPAPVHPPVTGAATNPNRTSVSDPVASTPTAKPSGIEVAGNVPLETQVAALGYSAFSGMRRRSMFATTDDAAPEHDDKSPVVEAASLPGLARLAPNGLWLQTESVETGCFAPDLMAILKSVESHYGRKLLVTSGMRDVEHNKRVGGRPLSLHTSCRAADIQMPGVSKWDLAQYLRALPGRGGVGTYCHTASVHIDIGRNRDWNWPCPQRNV